MMMEIQPTKTLADVLAEVETISPELSQYLHLYLDMIGEYEEEYKSNPRGILYCFPKGLDDDQMEIVSIAEKVRKSGKNPGKIIDVLEELQHALTEKPVAKWALKPVFIHYNLENESLPANPAGKKHIRIPNLLYERRELSMFFRACGLIEETESGKGSHTKWVDENGRMMELGSWSTKSWVKNVIKKLLTNGVAFEKIVKACEVMHIDFEVIND